MLSTLMQGQMSSWGLKRLPLFTTMFLVATKNGRGMRKQLSTKCHIWHDASAKALFACNSSMGAKAHMQGLQKATGLANAPWLQACMQQTYGLAKAQPCKPCVFGEVNTSIYIHTIYHVHATNEKNGRSTKWPCEQKLVVSHRNQKNGGRFRPQVSDSANRGG